MGPHGSSIFLLNALLEFLPVAGVIWTVELDSFSLSQYFVLKEHFADQLQAERRPLLLV
jgi:hypothetical protein